MVAITYITPNFAVTASLKAGDHIRLKARGFRSVINNLPDAEIPKASANVATLDVAITADDWRHEFGRVGLGFRHLPVSVHDIFEPGVIDAFERQLHELPGPILAHCKSGTRSALLWTLVAARHQRLDDVLAAAAKAGFDFGFLRSEIEASAQSAMPLAGHAPALGLCLDCPAAA